MPSPELGGGHEAARVHHASRRCGSRLAVCGACTAGRADTAYRRADPRAADDAVFQDRIGAFQQEHGAIGLEHRPKRAHRHPLGHDQCRRLADRRRSWSRSHPTSSWPQVHTLPPLLQATRTVPIVFPVATDPVGAGYVESLAQPGGNATGFMVFEFGMGGKFLELLKEIAPKSREWRCFGTPPSLLGSPVRCHSGRGAFAQDGGDPGQHAQRQRDRAVVKTFAHAPDSGLIVTASAATLRHRDLIITLTARHKLPAIYPYISLSLPAA